MTDDFIYLIGKSETGATDRFLQPITETTRTGVLAASVPVSRSEFYNAGQNGIRPDYEFIISPAEYHGETEVEITDERGETVHLHVYRTYERSADELEIYCEQSAGLNRRAET